MSKSSLESTWLYHEIGRCYLELEDFEQARKYGEQSNEEAEKAEDNTWKLNSCVLVGQALGEQLISFSFKCIFNIFFIIIISVYCHY